MKERRNERKNEQTMSELKRKHQQQQRRRRGRASSNRSKAHNISFVFVRFFELLFFSFCFFICVLHLVALAAESECTTPIHETDLVILLQYKYGVRVTIYAVCSAHNQLRGRR